jgi:hypothetical protein
VGALLPVELEPLLVQDRVEEFPVVFREQEVCGVRLAFLRGRDLQVFGGGPSACRLRRCPS